ncbi:MAG TPA: DNA double-strand break repair nuclease NurA [Firmicutes bacterium]|nr:DNA double-strand break repair nuclease NurA [Bacillota bacterium]
MTAEVDRSPFAELPAGLVEEVLGQATAAGDRLIASIRQAKEDRERYRKTLLERGMLQHESTVGFPSLPTTCGVDGSYAIERLLTADLCAAAAVAVEGLTPPSEKRHWSQPHHFVYVAIEEHHAETATVLRAVMLGRELLLAGRAPHDIVMLDMTLTLPIIYLNQALNQAPETPSLQCSQEFLAHCVEYLDAYLTVLRADRSDRQFIGLPKYSTRRELGHVLGWSAHHDDRGLLSLLLQSGELTRPMPLEQPHQPWHLNTLGLGAELRGQADRLAAEIANALEHVYVVYYKPHDWLPAVRVEMPQGVALNRHRLATVIQGLKHQCASPGILEPYPVYLADRMAKAAARAMPAFRQVATQRVAEEYEGDLADVFFAMHGYRSEVGG